MTETQITDEMVERACAALWHRHWDQFSENAKRPLLADMRDVLTAVAPMIAEACAKVADECDRQDEIDNGLAATGAAANAATAIRSLFPAK